jgi:transposase, IS30 family
MGHREAELVVCRRSRPVLVLHDSKVRATLMSRLAGKMATFRRLDPRMRGSVTFDNDTCFARHMMLRGMLSATTNFRDACASWQKGGVENANGRIRRWLPRGADLEEIDEADIQEIATTINLTPRKCLGYRFPVEAFLSEVGRDVQIRFCLSRRTSRWNPPRLPRPWELLAITSPPRPRRRIVLGARRRPA